MNQDMIQDRILASLTLAGMGDALGAPTEQWSIAEIAAKYGGLVTSFGEPPEDTFAGANEGRCAEVTDDASQMYYLARALIVAGGTLDYEGWVDCLLDWAGTSPKAGFMGPSTAGMVKALQEGSDTARVGIIGRSSRKMTSVGITNGAAMRVAPVGLIFPGDIERACKQALVTCLPSHDTDIAISAACSVAAAVAQAVVPGRLEDVIAAAVRGADRGEQLAKEHARIVPGASYRARLDLALNIACKATDDMTFMTDIERLVGNSVLAAESVPAALAVVLYAKGDPMRTISVAASMGNDTDSIATMAGSIVGAMAGTRDLPPKLVSEFRQANARDFDLDTMASGLAGIAWRHFAK
ncbi:ADP-ribosylglycohydrolase family protein [Ramlibacter sp. WS9]|uniref:ADP-ribosylglycohydrolase family protein n=1 Tax=Ramlibacter sp. WS9 TaxID=1882741 RepID=UPI0011449BCF|nr:ADP-ribosylglycohydrolase family protein [Ramlibacter sp. WS9]ROZ62738.1 ADP-ribosylglycohydrolase [Ramlibacter sp. WS9]